MEPITGIGTRLPPIGSHAVGRASQIAASLRRVVLVQPGAPSDAHCKFSTGLAAIVQVAGSHPTMPTLVMRDKFGNSITTLVGTAWGLNVSVSPKGNFTVRGTQKSPWELRQYGYTGDAGTSLLLVELVEQGSIVRRHITGSPKTIRIEAAPCAWTQTWVGGTLYSPTPEVIAPKKITLDAGTPYQLKASFFDPHGNLCRFPKLKFNAEFIYKTGLNATERVKAIAAAATAYKVHREKMRVLGISLPPPAPTPVNHKVTQWNSATLRQDSTGTYLLQARPTVTGEYRVTLHAHDNYTIPPVTVTVTPAPLRSTSSRLSCPTSVAGSATGCEIDSRDEFDNGLQKGGLVVCPRLQHSLGPAHWSAPRARPFVLDRGNGTYMMVYSTSVSGLYTLSMGLFEKSTWHCSLSSLNTANLMGPLLGISILPAAPSILTSSAEGGGLCGSMHEVATRFTVILRDRFRNGCNNADVAAPRITFRAMSKTPTPTPTPLPTGAVVRSSVRRRLGSEVHDVTFTPAQPELPTLVPSFAPTATPAPRPLPWPLNLAITVLIAGKPLAKSRCECRCTSLCVARCEFSDDYSMLF